MSDPTFAFAVSCRNSRTSASPSTRTSFGLGLGNNRGADLGFELLTFAGQFLEFALLVVSAGVVAEQGELISCEISLAGPEFNFCCRIVISVPSFIS